MAPCMDCPEGRYNPSEGATQCLLCEVGKYNPIRGAVECFLCEIGRYNPTEGAVACTDCPLNTTTATTGSISLGDCSIILPVELTHFQAVASGERVLLQWRTASEVNFDSFGLERSRDGISFEEIGRVSSTGSTQGDTYAFEYREEQAAGNYYYRLKAMDLDGTFEYSNIIVIQLRTSKEKAVLFPNPGKESISFYLENAFEEGADLPYHILSSQGQLIRSGAFLSSITTPYKIDTQSLSPGVYYLSLIETDIKFTIDL